MAYKVANINDLFRVKSDGAIEFGTSGAGTATYVLTSAGANATPTWTEPTTGTVTGSGLENRVARWTADGSDIGNGPITFSSNDSTFAGDVLIEDNIYLTDAGTTRAKIQLNSSDRDNLDIKAISLGSEINFFTVDTLALTLDANQNATFASAVWIPDYIYHVGDADSKFGFGGNNNYNINLGGDNVLDFYQTVLYLKKPTEVISPLSVKTGNDLRLYRSDNATYARFNYAGSSVGLDIDDLNSDGINLQQAGVNKLRIETNGSATFSESIAVADLPGNATSTSVLVKNETIGPELLSNGDFTGNPDLWSGDESITNGQLTKTANGLAYQSITLTSGATYYVTVDVASVSGTPLIYAAGLQSGGLSAGLNELYLVAGGSNNLFGINNGSGSVFNSISLKLVTSASDQVQTRQLGSGGFGDELWAVTPTDSNDIYNLNSANVGIGTATPSSKFQVEGAPANGVYLSYLYNSATHNSANGLNVQTSSNNILTYGLRVNTAGDSNALAVMGNGSVGIGTGSPATKLNVANAGEVIVRSSMTASDGFRGGFEADNQHTGGTIWSMFSTNNSDGYFGGGKFVIANESMGGVDANTTAKFVINGSGNVGIATVSPSAALDVQGTSALFMTRTSSGLATYIENDGGFPFLAMYQIGGGAKVLINTNGNSYFNGGDVGIGTTLPSYKLHVSGTGGTRMSITNTDTNWAALQIQATGNQADYIFFKDDTEERVRISALDSNDLVFSNTNSVTERMRIKSTGAIEIKGSSTTASAQAFITNDNSLLTIGSSVSGSVVKDIQFSSPSAMMYIDGSKGSVGIGTTSPDQTGYGYKVLTIMGGTTVGYAGTIELLAPSVDTEEQNYGIVSFGAGGTRTGMISVNRQAANNAGNMRFFTSPGGAGIQERMRIDKDGNVGIGIIPGNGFGLARLSLGTGAVANEILTFASASGGNAELRNTSSTGTFTFTNSDGSSEAMRITGASRVAIGSTTASYGVLEIETESALAYSPTVFTNGANIRLKSGGTATTGTTTGVSFGAGGAAELYFGLEQQSSTLAHAIWQMYSGSAYQTNMRLSHDGTLTVKGDIVAYGSPSDKRLKENIKPIESALDKAMKLQGVTFDWKKSDSELNIKEDIGFIAQDVQKVLPELVRENEDGMLSMRHQGVAPILLEAIKELKAEIEELKKYKCDCKR